MSAPRKMTTVGVRRMSVVRDRTPGFTISDIERVAFAMEAEILVRRAVKYERAGVITFHSFLGEWDVDHIVDFLFAAKMIRFDPHVSTLSGATITIGDHSLDWAVLAKWRAKATMLAKDGHVGWRLDHAGKIKRVGKVLTGQHRAG